MIARVAERGVQVTLTDDAKQLLGDMGYDPTYGARPLRRVIQKQLTDRLALALLEGKLREGDRGERRRRRRRAEAFDRRERCSSGGRADHSLSSKFQLDKYPLDQIRGECKDARTKVSRGAERRVYDDVLRACCAAVWRHP